MATILAWYQFFFDEAIIQQVSVGCKKCFAKISFGETLGWAIAECLELVIPQLKYLACYGSIDKLNQLICQVHEEHQIFCPNCMEFHGWQVLV